MEGNLANPIVPCQRGNGVDVRDQGLQYAPAAGFDKWNSPAAAKANTN